MNAEQKEWYKRYQSSLGVREMLRLMGFFVLWMLVCIFISVFIILTPLIIPIFLFSPLLFILIATRSGWRPAYRLMRKIYGNPNMPEEPMPRLTERQARQPRKWWSFLPSVWWMVVVIGLVYLAVKYFITNWF